MKSKILLIVGTATVVAIGISAYSWFYSDHWDADTDSIDERLNSAFNAARTESDHNRIMASFAFEWTAARLKDEHQAKYVEDPRYEHWAKIFDVRVKAQVKAIRTGS